MTKSWWNGTLGTSWAMRVVGNRRPCTLCCEGKTFPLTVLGEMGQIAPAAKHAERRRDEHFAAIGVWRGPENDRRHNMRSLTMVFGLRRAAADGGTSKVFGLLGR